MVSVSPQMMGGRVSNRGAIAVALCFAAVWYLALLLWNISVTLPSAHHDGRPQATHENMSTAAAALHQGTPHADDDWEVEGQVRDAGAIELLVGPMAEGGAASLSLPFREGQEGGEEATKEEWAGNGGRFRRDTDSNNSGRQQLVAGQGLVGKQWPAVLPNAGRSEGMWTSCLVFP